MVSKIFGSVIGLVLITMFSIATFVPDLLRGYIDVSVKRATVTNGQRVYETYCVGCHGASGNGDTDAAKLLKIKPRNFINGDYKFFHGGEAGPLPTDASLTLTIRKGLPGSAMPAFPLISEQEVADVRSYIKTFRAGGWIERAPAGVGEVAAVPPIIGKTGQELFTAAGCIACHQLNSLKSAGGVGPDLSTLGGRSTRDAIQQSILQPNAVIASSCPAGPCAANIMPQNFGQRLSGEQITALVDFLASQK